MLWFNVVDKMLRLSAFKEFLFPGLVFFASAIGISLYFNNGQREILAWSGLIAASGTVLTALATRQRDHERSRRQNALDLMRNWYQLTYSREPGPSIRRLIAALDVPTCAAIESENEFYVSRPQWEAIAPFLKTMRSKFDERLIADIDINSPSASSQEADGDGIRQITAFESHQIRSLIVEEANLLEIVAAAYMSGVADKTIIEDEFYHIFYRDDVFLIGNYINCTQRHPSLKKLRVEFDDKKIRKIKFRNEL